MARTHLTRPALLLALLLFPALAVPATSAVLAKGRDSLYPRSYVLAYIPNGTDVQQVNPDTLANMPGYGIWLGAAATIPSPQIEVSAAGKTLALVSYRDPGAIYRAKDVWVSLLTADHGAQLAAFHPQRAMSIAGFTPDGRYLYGYGPANARGLQELYIISARNGHVVYHLSPGKNAGIPLFDLGRKRLFLLDTLPLSAGSHQPQAPILASYDLATGQQLASLRLPGVMAAFGQTGTQVNGDPVMEQWVPGVALSPDGNQIAILDGSNDSLRLVDTGTMTVTKTEAVDRPQSLLQQVSQFAGLLPVTADAKEIEGTWLSMQYAPNGSSLYVTGYRGSVDAAGTFKINELGMQRIDVRSGTVAASAIPDRQIWWWQEAPDGSAVYALVPGQTPDGQFACPCALQRLDPQTLQSTAQRMFGSSASDSSPTFYILAAP